jgi:alpha-1,3-glucosyltransferase
VQTEASKEINSIFPDGLRSPVLHYVQFQDHHRMDDLGEPNFMCQSLEQC